MSVRIVIAVVLAIVVFGLYSWMTTREETFTAPVIMPSGPNAPSVRPPVTMPITVSPEEKPFDPSARQEESAEHPERLRYPERSFGPGIEPSDAPGLQESASQETQRASQSFGPDFAQNEGLFLDGVVANDSTLKTSYSNI